MSGNWVRGQGLGHSMAGLFPLSLLLCMRSLAVTHRDTLVPLWKARSMMLQHLSRPGLHLSSVASVELQASRSFGISPALGALLSITSRTYIAVDFPLALHDMLVPVQTLIYSCVAWHMFRIALTPTAAPPATGSCGGAAQVLLRVRPRRWPRGARRAGAGHGRGAQPGDLRRQPDTGVPHARDPRERCVLPAGLQ